MKWQRFYAYVAAGVVLLAAAERRVVAQYDPPAGYYSTATGTGTTLKNQLHNIIDGHSTISYDSLRTALQVSDADPTNPNRIIVVYNNRVPVTKQTSGSIPGWDNGNTWNREHSWPQSRGVDTEAMPDGSDMHHVFPARNSDNSARGNLNFGGAFGAQPRGTVNDGGTKYYPGDLDVGLIARAQFYMAVRYDGSDSGTKDLELVAGNPTGGGTTMGDLNRLIEWHYAAVPDTFELRRNHVIYTDYQNNRNPFIDRPEFVWSVFVDQANDSRITINGATTDANGGSTADVNLGRVFKNSAVPAAQSFTLNKAGTDGTYFEVTTSGLATSSLTGRYNAFRTNQTDSKSISVGLNTSTSNVGLKSGMVTVNNLDVTTGGGVGRGANDANDVFHVSLTVLDHATPSFVNDSINSLLVHNFGTITTAVVSPSFSFDVFNYGTTPEFTANMDFDAVIASGDTSAFSTNFGSLVGTLSLAGGAGQTFTASLGAAMAGTFAANYTLRFSDEDIVGAQNNKDILLELAGTVVLAGDFNRDGTVDAADYVVWKKWSGQSVEAFSGADADGNGIVDALDLGWWNTNFGQVAAVGSGAQSGVPEPGTVIMVLVGVGVFVLGRRGR